VRDGNPDVSSLTAVNEILYFNAASVNFADGFELWRSDGTTAGTWMVEDIWPGDESSYPTNLTAAGDDLFFMAANEGGRGLWVSNGTAEGTILLKSFSLDPPGGYIPGIWLMNGLIYFLAVESPDRYSLWKSDGTVEGTVMVTLFPPGMSQSPREVAAVSGTVFFALNDLPNRVPELWLTDGAPAGTRRVWNGILNFKLVSLTPVGGRLLFVVMDDSGIRRQLWSSDGTEAGTQLLVDVPQIQPGHSIFHLTGMGNRVFFSTRGAPGDDRQLWKSDGTADGTEVVRTFDTYSFGDWGPVATGSTLYFAAHDEIHGDELWKSDGTAAGTVLCADLTGDSGSSTPHSLALAGNNLFFGATTEAFGLELWKISTETPEISVSGNGVRISPGSQVPSASNFTHFGGTPVNGGTIVRTFTIGNYGSVNLIPGGASVTGPEAADFAVSTLSGSPLPPGGSIALQVTFDPSGPGLRRAVLSIASNDGEENRFTFAISGTGGHAGIEAWRLTHFGTTANSGDAADGADPDFDGIPNLIEWGFGSDPVVRSPLPATTTVVSGNIELTAGRSVEALTAGAVISVQ
jgi:ELWxxDGT repeat protein